MARILYTVMPAADQWTVTRDGTPGMSYVTQEAAFEVAVSEAAADMRSGHEIALEVLTTLDNPVDERGSPRK